MAPRRKRRSSSRRGSTAGQIAIIVAASIGDYRAGDEIWCDTLEPEDYGQALNRDILVPRPAGRFLFGRLIDRDEEQAADPSARGGRAPAGRRQSALARGRGRSWCGAL